MVFHLLAFAAARGFLQVFQVSAPLLWPFNLWLPSARHLPEACAVFYGALASHAAWLRGTVRSHRRHGSSTGGVGEYISQALHNISSPY
ncbi:uncharacterized protein LOC133888632 [Phragmites australis]|uniref:uncharacterized protein LOC133888632 n=1 Tax=Phragmites australis TaxID=29695 RepID=UPI002D774A35|nr:uncharacterized protein LOC133888632 [Phragmites australis]